MGRIRTLVLVLVLFALLSVSCSKDEMNITDLQVQGYVRTDSTMGLSVYAVTRSTSKNDKNVPIQMVVKSPDGNLSWSFDAVKATFDGRSYYGSADISMPAGLSLPKGQWSVEIIGRDGSTVNREFDISYTDAAEALGNFTEAGQEAPWFDEKSNLTVIK